MRKKEIDWFYEGGAAAIFPDGMLSSFFIFLVVHLWHDCVHLIEKDRLMVFNVENYGSAYYRTHIMPLNRFVMKYYLTYFVNF